MASPIQRLDQVALFGSPRMWIALVGVVSLIGGFLVWSVLARPPVTASVGGVISTAGGPLEVGATVEGSVDSMFVTVGTQVELGNTLATIIGAQGQKVRIRTPVAGTVIELATQEGDFVSSGEGIATIQRVDQNLVALALVPSSSIAGIVPGDPVQIAPDAVSSGQYGYITGTVSSVASTPMSVSRVQRLVGGVAGYESLSSVAEPIIEVEIALDLDESTPSGFAWTIGAGPPYELVSGTPWQGQVITGDKAPLAVLFGSS